MLESSFEALEPAPAAPPLPRPGLGLAVLIVLGIPLVHLVTTLLFVVVAVPELVTKANADSLTDYLSADELVRLLAFDQTMFVLAAFLATWWAFGRRFPRVIPIHLPAMRHVTLIFLLVLPLAVMDGFLAQQVIDIGENVFGESPSQGDLPELLDGVSREASTGLLLLILAVLARAGRGAGVSRRDWPGTDRPQGHVLGHPVDFGAVLGGPRQPGASGGRVFRGRDVPRFLPGHPVALGSDPPPLSEQHPAGASR